MTKKRFTAIPETVSYKDNLTGERLCPKREKDYYAVLNKMNKLSEENEQLKQEYQKLKHRHSLLHDVCLDTECERDSLKKDVESLEKDNEQLKSNNNRLVNETARIVAEHQRKVLDLIDKSLEKDKQYYEMSYEDYLNGRIEALEELKKELQE